ncbi:hypothetical protein QJ854_gp956 [Moumouvirus goulette]|uniref:Uncharacterized protein n=1 Tax=Moumouvirus goulette TaxID=1247379 RepID=M1PLM9_9VIRU|nr:hypothetical protein QJ854_gp956 [Moumouvirus goulette]AGF84826.1 hypothetical protein glt_00017 [Moumouvirus goulette]
MSYLPIYVCPGSYPVNLPNNRDDIDFKWIDSLGGGSLPGPIKFGDTRPDGKKAKCGIMTTSIGDDGEKKTLVEYHYLDSRYLRY